MDLAGRIISIRKHKKVTFFDILLTDHSVIQCMIDNMFYINLSINVGDLIEAYFNMTYNNSHIKIAQVIKIYNLIPTQTKLPVKYCTKKFSDSIILNNRNLSYFGGEYNLSIWKFKIKLLQKIRKYLSDNNLLEVNTDILNKYRGTYKANPFVTFSEQSKTNEYLRITMETELKKISAITMQSVYEIGNVYRNMGKCYDHINEYTVLEMVVPRQNNDYLYKAINDFSVITKQLLTDEFSSFTSRLNNYKQLSNINIKEYAEICMYDGYEKEKKKLINTIVINIPCGSPLAKKSNNFSKEFEWIFYGYSIAHGYEDENSFSILQKRFNEQKKELLKNGIESVIDEDFINIMKYAAFESCSLVIGIDRLIMLVMELPNVLTAHNPLGL